MQATVRVLVVDDSVTVRHLLSRALGADPDIEVVGTASNGRIALARIEQLNPDLVTLDIEMPVMDGLICLKQLRKLHPKLPVIMFSSMTHRGAAATIDALTLGATDYLAKPAQSTGVEQSIRAIQDQLIPKIKALCGTLTSPYAPVPSGPPPRRPAGGQELPRVAVVAIGVSTGGPQALSAIIPALPADFAAPILIVQHMPPMFTGMLADRLTSVSSLGVSEAEHGAQLEVGRVWLAPGDQHLSVRGSATRPRLCLDKGPPQNSCRPSADVLFRSVANIFGSGALGVVLTGMGQDGLRGSIAIRDAGGAVLAQDRVSSVVWGMPGSVANAGVATDVVPLHKMATELVRRVQPNAPAHIEP